MYVICGNWKINIVSSPRDIYIPNDKMCHKKVSSEDIRWSVPKHRFNWRHQMVSPPNTGFIEDIRWSVPQTQVLLKTSDGQSPKHRFYWRHQMVSPPNTGFIEDIRWSVPKHRSYGSRNNIFKQPNLNLIEYMCQILESNMLLIEWVTLCLEFVRCMTYVMNKRNLYL